MILCTKTSSIHHIYASFFIVCPLIGVFLGVAETIVSSLLCCGVGIVQCLFNLLYYVIGVCNTKKPLLIDHKIAS